MRVSEGKGVTKRLKESIEKVDEFAESVIMTRKKELALQHDKSDLLTVFMRLKDENGMAYSDKFLRDICVNFILAGLFVTAYLQYRRGDQLDL